MESYSQSPSELRTHIKKLGQLEYVVNDLLPIGSVALLAGDSGLGKTPACIQLGISVAAGLPFLGHSTVAGSVLYADFENPPKQFDKMAKDISQALGLADTPENFRRLDHPTSPHLEIEAKKHRPSLIIIDTLRFLDELAETEASKATFRMRWFKQLAKLGSCVLFIHHMRKQNDEFLRPHLADEKIRVIEWMRHVAGSSILVTQCDIRIGFENAEDKDDYDVIMRGYRRGIGESGPWKLKRVLEDTSGDPLAYELYTSIAAVDKKAVEQLRRLPDTFTFKEACHLLSLSKKTVSLILHKFLRLNLVIREGEFKATLYRKLPAMAGGG